MISILFKAARRNAGRFFLKMRLLSPEKSARYRTIEEGVKKNLVDVLVQNDFYSSE